MQQVKWIKRFALLLTLVLVVSACSNNNNNTSAPKTDAPKTNDATTPVNDAEPAPGKALRVGVQGSLSTGDPHMTGAPADMTILINIFDPLVRRDAKGVLQPSLATSWKLVDPNTWEFKLREGVKFHNGEEFNAETVQFSLERIFKEGSKSPIQELRSVESVEVVDPLTIKVHTTTVDPYIPDKLALFAGMMVPKQYLEEKGDENFHSNPVGTGAYVFQSWVKDGSMELTGNPDYWNGAPAITELTFKFIPDGQSRVAALLSSDVDMINKVPATALDTVSANDKLRIDKADGTRIYYLSTASLEGPTTDVKVRQAISYAVNTELLIDKLLGGNGVQIAAPIAGSNFGSDVDLKPYPYDPEKAKALLKEAGYPDGFSIVFNTEPDFSTEIAQAITQMLADVGIKADLKPLPGAEFEDKYAGGKLAPLWNNGYSVWQGDPTTLISTFFYTGMPRAKYFSADLDKMIDEMKQMTDLNERKQALHAILKVLHDDAPWTYLFQENDLYGVNSNVTWTVPADQLMELKDANIK
jgi:peptide/nickel transport system substrate-binding protein